MILKKDLYFKKKILIYGLGISGISCLNHLKVKNTVRCFDDNLKKLKFNNLKKYLISKKEIYKIKFDHIIISPGIDILKCSLKNYLKQNKSKICTDLDVFYSEYPKNLK